MEERTYKEGPLLDEIQLGGLCSPDMVGEISVVDMALGIEKDKGNAGERRLGFYGPCLLWNLDEQELEASASLSVPSAQNLSTTLEVLQRELNCTCSKKAKRRPGAYSLTWMQVVVIILAAFIGRSVCYALLLVP